MNIVEFAEKYLNKTLFDFQKEMLLAYYEGRAKEGIKYVGTDTCLHVIEMYKKYINEEEG